MWREALLRLGNSPFTMSHDFMMLNRAAAVLRNACRAAGRLL
jgi:hypothetical protein